VTVIVTLLVPFWYIEIVKFAGVGLGFVDDGTAELGITAVFHAVTGVVPTPMVSDPRAIFRAPDPLLLQPPIVISYTGCLLPVAVPTVAFEPLFDTGEIQTVISLVATVLKLMCPVRPQAVSNYLAILDKDHYLQELKDFES